MEFGLGLARLETARPLKVVTTEYRCVCGGVARLETARALLGQMARALARTQPLRLVRARVGAGVRRVRLGD